MASINVRRETGKLYFDFRYRNQRCREQTELMDTPSNRRKMEAMLERIQAEILLGQFEYEKTFPNSKMLPKLKQQDCLLRQVDSDEACFNDFAETWFTEMTVQWRESYETTVKHIVFQRIVPFFSSIYLTEITKSDVLKFRSHIACLTQKNGKKLSNTHINRHMKILRMIINEAADRFNFTSPYRGIKPLKVGKTDIQPFSQNEVSQIINHVRADFKDYFIVRFFTGMRTAEIDGLKWKYVDLKNGIIKIRESIVKGKVTYTKNDHSQRDIQISDPVRAALLRMQQHKGANEFVFVNSKGKPFDHNHITKRVWYPLLNYLGIERRNPYQTRHTTATYWLASGESAEWIANQMGHANTEMLFRVYSRYVPNLTRQDGSVANRMFKNILAPKTGDTQDE